jgi:enoyl-[acyl-carrier-protein] reductase (NADH)
MLRRQCDDAADSVAPRTDPVADAGAMTGDTIYIDGGYHILG